VSSAPRGEVVALGLLQGPAELLPVSSSGHLEAIPWLLGWETARLPGEERKALAVALHAGTAVALVVGLGRELRPLSPARMAAAVAPPALAGLLLERPIEARLGGPRSLAAGLLAGSVAMCLADRAPRRRRRADATPGDGAWLGLAQACALVPGVSRSAATLAAARARGFDRPDAARLSLEAALPVLAAATVLKAARGGLRSEHVPGAAASLLATLAARPLWRLVATSPLAPWAVERAGLAALLVVRHHRAP
jgi:undecaprenyl-diphosphatase